MVKEGEQLLKLICIFVEARFLSEWNIYPETLKRTNN